MQRPNDPSAPSRALFNWYPGHMARALREIKERLKMVDLVMEVRDARVPLISGNQSMVDELGQKCRLIIFNKANLATDDSVKAWTAWLEKQEENFMFVDCFDKTAIKKAVQIARKIVLKNRERTGSTAVKKAKLRFMILGLPNTGKSTIINQLAQKGAAKVADKPGVTQIQQWITIENDVELLDTPGVMPPQIHREEHALWLSAIHAIPDDIADEETSARFVVKHLLNEGSETFLARYKIEDPAITIEDTLVKIATLRGCVEKGGLPDLNRVYKLVLQEFRRGELGKTSFEKVPKA
jgi:ribosome biogenesis GTPase A